MISELDNYLSRLDDLHGQVSSLIADLPAEALNWRPIEGKDDHITNSLAVLTAHIAGAEHFWIAEVIGGRPATRDRDAEFVTVAATPAELLQILQKVSRETREVLSALSESDLSGTRQAKDRMVSVRWGILHVIDPLCVYNSETIPPNKLVCRAKEKRHDNRGRARQGRRRNEDRGGRQSKAAPAPGRI